MTYTEWIIFFFIVQAIHFLGTWKLYKEAGYQPWQAAVPIYNAVILMKIIKRPIWWILLLFVPAINIIMFGVIWIETIRSFGKNKIYHIFLVLLTLGFYCYVVNYSSNLKYIADRNLRPKSAFSEAFNSIIFAVIAATIVHSYFIQPYIIPTGSLEKSLLVGDFLFVSKFHYGARLPMTAVSFPMVHDTLPLVKTRSYLKKPQIPYLRLPGFEKIERNEIVVFSWPADTVRKFFVREKGVRKPIDKKSNYVKRCVGIPGDTLEIIDGYVHTNGKQNQLPDRAKIQFTHLAYHSRGVSSRKLHNSGYKGFIRSYRIKNITQNTYNQLQPYILGVSNGNLDNYTVITSSKGLDPAIVRRTGMKVTEIMENPKELVLTPEKARTLAKESWIDSVKQRVIKTKSANTIYFPNKAPFDWNEDNFGPIVIPKKGTSVVLNKQNLPLYKKLIVDYEKNKLKSSLDGIFINGVKSTSYTFKQDYYWMMGDNRHQSEDSRFWGFVPNDHIVGKPVFIWFSIDGINDGIRNWKIRWDRIFTTVGGSGERTSYFPYFIAIIVLWQLIVYIRKKTKKAT